MVFVKACNLIWIVSYMGRQIQIINLHDFIELEDIKETGIETTYKHELMKVNTLRSPWNNDALQTSVCFPFVILERIFWTNVHKEDPNLKHIKKLWKWQC
jgi:hypothetical protein